MALVLVCVASVTTDATWQLPTDDYEALFALIHTQWLSDVANCEGKGPTQYGLCRELAFETFITGARHLK